MLTIKVNGIEKEVEVPEDVPLLWVLREELGLTGTKFGCGKALCGSCTIHIDGQARRSCVMPVASAVGHEVTTIEGILGEDGTLHEIQKIWIEENVPQCGYCQSGQIMSALSLYDPKGDVTDEDIDAVMTATFVAVVHIRESERPYKEQLLCSNHKWRPPDATSRYDQTFGNDGR